MKNHPALTRRHFVGGTAFLAGAAALPSLLRAQDAASQVNRYQFNETTQPVWTNAPLTPGEPGKDYKPTITLNGSTLPFRVVDGVKVFHLNCEEVDHVFVPKTDYNNELRAHCWGYNGQIHGPTIEGVEGDRVRIYVTNKLPASTSVHWHGILLPNGMDGVGGLTQAPDPAGRDVQVRVHRLAARHVHVPLASRRDDADGARHDGHVRHPSARARAARRQTATTSSCCTNGRSTPGTRRPDPNEMTDFNVLTFNGKRFPGTAPLVAKLGDRVRIRIGNLCPMDHHPIHLHGHRFEDHRDRRRPDPRSRAVAGDDGARPGRQHADDRVRRRQSRRLGDALPHDPSRDEPDGPRPAEHRSASIPATSTSGSARSCPAT